LGRAHLCLEPECRKRTKGQTRQELDAVVAVVLDAGAGHPLAELPPHVTHLLNFMKKFENLNSKKLDHYANEIIYFYVMEWCIFYNLLVLKLLSKFTPERETRSCKSQKLKLLDQ
jgi:hypothetical protein